METQLLNGIEGKILSNIKSKYIIYIMSRPLKCTRSVSAALAIINNVKLSVANSHDDLSISSAWRRPGFKLSVRTSLWSVWSGQSLVNNLLAVDVWSIPITFICLKISLSLFGSVTADCYATSHFHSSSECLFLSETLWFLWFILCSFSKSTGSLSLLLKRRYGTYRKAAPARGF